METASEKRTFGWYCTHDFLEDGSVYEIGVNERYVNAFGPKTNIAAIERMGLADIVPTVENVAPMLDALATWWKKVEEAWSEFEKGGVDLHVLRTVVGRVIEDPSIDPEIARAAYERASILFITTIVKNPSCPRDVLEQVITRSGSKSDQTRDTKGGEATCFVLHNKRLPGDLVDLCVRHTRKVSNLESAVTHPNVLRETLVRVYHDPKVKSDALKSQVLNVMVRRGMLKVE